MKTTLVVIPNSHRTGLAEFEHAFHGCRVVAEGSSVMGLRCGSILIHKDVDRSSDWYCEVLMLRVDPDTMVFEFERMN